MSDIKTIYLRLDTDKSGPFKDKKVLRVWDGKDITRYLFEAEWGDTKTDAEFLDFLGNYLKAS